MLSLLALAVAHAQTPPAPKPAAAAATAPTVAPCTSLLPTYTVDAKNPPQAGSMFAVKVGDKQLLVTSFSMFGPSGGFKDQIPGADLPARVTAATARDTYDPNVICARSKKALPMADALGFGNGHDMTRDIAVFEVDADPTYAAQTTTPVPLVPLAFAAKAPKVGDKVWLLAALKGQTARAFEASVVQSDAGYVFFQFTDGTLDLAGTPGAPVVDATGALIGVDVAGQKMPDGALIGGCTPLATTKSRIEAAAKG